MTVKAQLDSRARLTLPPEVRERLHLNPGDTVLFVERAGEVVMTTLQALKDRARGAWAHSDYGVDDLLAERRAEPGRDAPSDEAGTAPGEALHPS
ncbi:AbrB/MazE/SpoVT family DNA-binding domain-containing protein [Kineococcus glutinatus]|uniref:SpoVT-AbrB domain-containing protein n=1 Tax=Kineococcus glutinatus TaxID=1070872 RepID=A0ABP9HYA8_9ACTN